MKIRLNKVLVLVLVLALMSTTVFAIPNKSNGIGRENAPGQDKFNDTEGWAERYIERMAKKDVIKGMGNGAFMPGNTAKEIETVIMLLRLIEPGFDDEDFGKGSELPEDYNVKKPADWMVPYIEKAYDEGLITEKNFDPNFPTKRSKAAVYFVRAAAILGDGLDQDLKEALDDEDLILEFNDFNSIPEEHVGYVYVAYELGLIEGYPGNTFQANKAINRAELAAMMYRLDENYESDYSYSLTGKIEEIDSNPDQITLKVKGKDETFDISTNVAVYIDGEEKSLTDLDEGMVVEVTIFNNQIIDITVKSNDEFDTEDYEGVITSLVSPFDEITIEEKNNKEYTFSVTSETAIEVDGVVLENELIEKFVGLNAKVEAEDLTATSIEIELDKEDLSELVEDVDDLVQGDYTDSTWSNFKTALTNAKDVLDKDSPTQEDIYTEYISLADAIANLEEKE
ncbi:MAG: S-layer homology domain-containing protein [Eubacteriales bacterium]